MGRADQPYCQYCGDPLDLGSEFIFLVEAQTYEEEVVPLELVQASHYYHGEPLRICKECRDGIEKNRQDLEEEAAHEKAETRRFLRILAIVGIADILYLLALVIVDLLP